MLASRRWRDWKPPMIEVRADYELTELTEPAFVSSVSAPMERSQIIPASAEPRLQEWPTPPAPLYDPDEWREPLARWISSDCIPDSRLHESVGKLHVAFSEWEVGQGEVPCGRASFERLLIEHGWEIHRELMLVAGLMTRRTLWESGYFPELLRARASNEPSSEFSDKYRAREGLLSWHKEYPSTYSAIKADKL